MKEQRPARILALFTALALTAVGGPARANEPGPSFDCKKAATPVEKTICNDAFTGFRDGALSKLYSGLVDSLIDRAREALRSEQRAWLKARDRACGKVGDNERADCLNALYDKRLGRLDRQMRRAKLGPGAHGLASFSGTYSKSMKNFSGSITVVEVPKGPAWVEISTVSGPTHHTCSLWTRQARRQGATLVWRDTDESKCEVSLTFKGRTVRAESNQACQVHCGARGHFGGLTYTRGGR